MYLGPQQKRKSTSLVIVLGNEPGRKSKGEGTALATGTWHLISALNDLQNQIQLLILQKYGVALACKRWVKFWHQSSRPFMTS